LQRRSGCRRGRAGGPAGRLNGTAHEDADLRHVFAKGELPVYELIQVSEHDYYIQSPAKIGLVRLNEREVCLIDSGNDKDAGRKVRQLLDANGWKLTAIYNTHSNADHIGGNRYLQGQTGCKVYAPGIDCAFTRYPILEPSFLYGGFPCKELRHKFLMAQSSDAMELTAESVPARWQILPLPGHFFDMVGFRTPDDVVYLADCLSSRETLEKYGRGYTYDGSYEYIDSALEPDNYKVFGKATRPDFEYGVLRQLPFVNISFERDVTEKLWSEKEKLAYAATPLFLLRAEKPVG
jgi:glyoxylase-like metal-dependent hydrolase (beta-lactamase superfamily II)